MTLNPDRTRDLAHYVISNSNSAQLGKTKLNKVMWCADVLHYRKHGESISGQTAYVRMQNGPVPNRIFDVLEEMVTDGTLLRRDVPTPVGVRHEYMDLDRADPDRFSPREIESIYEAITAIMPLSATEASDMTHGPIWDELSNGEQMPIGAASIIPAEVRPEDLDWAVNHSEAFRD